MKIGTYTIYIYNRENKNKGKSQTIKEMGIGSESKKIQTDKKEKLGITIIAKINKLIGKK